jgi:hypothetical protein
MKGKAARSVSVIERSIYRYYGVTQEDIDNKTQRYETLVRILAGR